MSKVSDFLNEINSMPASKLSRLARHIHDVEFYEDVKEKNQFTDREMREIIIYLVKKLMHLNLVIPPNGSEVNLLAVAQDLHDDPEFGGKYDNLAEDIQDG